MKFYAMSASSLVKNTTTAEKAIKKGWADKQSGIVHYVADQSYFEEASAGKRMIFGAGDKGYTDEKLVEVCKSGARYGKMCINQGWVKIVEGVAVGGSENWQTLAQQKRPLWVFK